MAIRGNNFRGATFASALLALAALAACGGDSGPVNPPDPANRAPQAVGTIAAQELVAGGDPATVSLAGYFSDPDNDALTYGATSSATNVVTAAASGSTITLTPVGEGSATITVTATDPGGLSAAQTIAVTVAAANRAPVAVGSIPGQALSVGAAAATIDLAGYFDDPDGDPLAFAAASGDTAVAAAAVSGSTITLTPVGEGSATVTVTATDPGGLSAAQTIAVTVAAANRAPVAVGSIEPRTLAEGGDSVLVDVADFFSDPDGDELAYSAATSDSAVAAAEKVDGSVITVRALGMGTASITVVATDPDGLSATQSFGITVQADGDPYWRRMEGLLVYNGRFTFLGIPYLSCSPPVKGIKINGVTYTIHSSKWQTRADSASEWSDVSGTERTDGSVCPLDTETPGEYRLVGDMSIDDFRALYSSENTFTVSSG